MTLLSSVTNSSVKGAMVPLYTSTATASNIVDWVISGIPQNYQDLYLVANLRRTDAVTTSTVFCTPYVPSVAITQSTTTFGSNGSAYYSGRSVDQSGQFSGTCPGASAASGIFGSFEMYLFDYANTSRFKTLLTKSASDTNGSGDVNYKCGLVQTTLGIPNINVSTNNGSIFWQAGSTITLYGIRRAVQ